MTRCAIIGLRNRGLSILDEVLACPEFACVALCDRDPGRLRLAGARVPAARLEADAAAILADPAVEAVFLVLPNHLHEPLAGAALAAGKHVFLEKPMARDVAECRRLIRARDAAARVLMIGYQQRFAAAAVQARAVLASGVLGRIASATARWNRRMAGGGLWDRGAWFLDPAQGGGGPFIDIGVHKLDLCLDLLGYPRIRRLVAKSRHGLGVRAAAARGCDYRIEDALDAWLFADDLDIRVEASYFRNQEQEEYHDVELIGERGGLRIDAGGLRAWTVAADGAIAPLPPPAAAATGAVGHFADVLAGRTPLRPTPEQSLALQGIVDACYRSAGSGSGLIPLGDAEAMP